METPSPSYYAVIPANVRYCKDIEPNAKLLYGEISALCNKEGYCWANNRYFADLYGVEIRTIKMWLESLKAHNFIECRTEGNRFNPLRKIYLTHGVQKVLTEGKKRHGGGKKKTRGGEKKDTHNTTSNTTSKNPPLSSPPASEPDKPKEPEPPEKSLRSEEEDSFQFLEGTSLSPSQQKRLRDAYPRDQILRALKISERMPIKKGLMNLLWHILKNPAQYEDQQTDKPRCPKQQMALKYNQELAKIDAKLATQNEKLIPNNAVKILIGNGLQQLSLKAYDFESDLKMALEELKTMRKRE